MNQETDILREAIRHQLPEVDSAVDHFIMEANMLSMIAEIGVSFVEGGVTRYQMMNSKASDLVEVHRAASYRPGLGTWFTLKIAVDRSGPVDVEIDYDDEPKWDFPVRDNYYADDFLRFPRDAAHAPEWLVAKLKEYERELLEKGAQLPW